MWRDGGAREGWERERRKKEYSVTLGRGERSLMIQGWSTGLGMSVSQGS